MKIENLRLFLDQKVEQYNSYSFIENDPICIPHKFTKKQDIEITGFVAAVLAWGQRKTIINKCNVFFDLMDNDPHDFIVHHQEQDLKRFLGFKHRTFNATDALYFIEFFKNHYLKNPSLESAFLMAGSNREWNAKDALESHFDYFFAIENHPVRTYKHIPNPKRNSACKRLNMFLRWMVRKDEKGVDFGIWKNIPTSNLICPCDVHVDRVARKLQLIKRKQTDWKTALELTEQLKKLDPLDPVKYDFALFGLGVEERF